MCSTWERYYEPYYMGRDETEREKSHLNDALSPVCEISIVFFWFKAKRETDRRLEELRDNYERGGAETERKLKRELKKTKALLKDAQAVIESQVC